jgi:hexosaminidase
MNYTLGTAVTPFNLDLVSVTIPNISQQTQERLDKAVIRQRSMLGSQGVEDGSSSVGLAISINGALAMPAPSLDMDESYTLQINTLHGVVQVDIGADTYYGARHAIETLFQLSEWDPATSQFVILDQALIHDQPFFPHRGVSLDSARNFIPVETIKEMLDSMSYSKMNVFHWHITDTQSFALELQSLPDFTWYGAYRPDMVYSRAEVLDILDYAAARGILVIPELDAPAHVGAGWQAVDDSFTVCLEAEPWEQFCLEPPCGQLNPAAPGMFDVLETIHKEFLDIFSPSVLHMGGDEVHFGCWNSSDMIVAWLEERGHGRMEQDFLFIWDFYQQESLARVRKASGELGIAVPKATLWSSHLTLPEYISYLDPTVYNVQFWVDSTNMEDPTIKTVAEAGFNMIFSNYDATYLDCGNSGWVSDGNNWCSPYKGWQLIYENDPHSILESHQVSNLEEAKQNVLGGEVAIWTEQTDYMSLMSKIEPRASAYGERLWRGPSAGTWRQAESRMVRHRERLRERGVSADALVHRWCNQHMGKCVLPEA